jgi:hypothetical protein
MLRWIVVGLSGSLLSAGPARAQGLDCRVHVVKSSATDSIPKKVFRQVEGWVNAPERGSRLVPTLDQADVLLELERYRPRILADGNPVDEWWFVARRLSEPSRHRAIYRFVHLAPLDRKGQAYFEKRLPLVLADVCFGYLPKVASDAKDPVER